MRLREGVSGEVGPPSGGSCWCSRSSGCSGWWSRSSLSRTFRHSGTSVPRGLVGSVADHLPVRLGHLVREHIADPFEVVPFDPPRVSTCHQRLAGLVVGRPPYPAR